MEHKLGLLFFGIIALIALGGLTFMIKESVTGGYVAGGGGRYYYGPQKIQLEPAEACIYSGYEAVYPIQVKTNEFGTLVSVCRSSNGYITVPLVQTALIR